MSVSIRTENLPKQANVIVKQEQETVNTTPVQNLFAKHFDHEANGAKLNNASNLELSNCNAQSLHSFILDLEKIGKEVKIEKKTIIEIVDRD
jgi:hypothetical protein